MEMSMNDMSGMSPKSESIHTRFTRFLINAGALKFGDFTLKSGRRSPYFINAGAFDTGNLISRLGGFYAERVLSAIGSGELPGDIDTVFGPAYKGIPLAVSTAMALTADLANVGYTFDRKERKDHGRRRDRSWECRCAMA
uniref:CAZy families GH47 protein n=1 Tax=uncultured Leptosphaeria TaxID=526459 RepID=A0A060BY75_9PLEO|nr:CAZy families GH47 protein [uncultured Leptosphaeria]